MPAQTLTPARSCSSRTRAGSSSKRGAEHAAIERQAHALPAVMSRSADLGDEVGQREQAEARHGAALSQRCPRAGALPGSPTAWPGCRAHARAWRSGASRRAAALPSWPLPSSVTAMPPTSEPRNRSACFSRSSGPARRSGLRTSPPRTSHDSAPQPQMEGADLERGEDPHAAQARIAPRQQIEIGRVARAEPARAEARNGPAAQVLPAVHHRSRAATDAANGRPSVPRIDCVVARPGSKLLPGAMTMVTASSAANCGAMLVDHRGGDRRHRARPAHHQHAGLPGLRIERADARHESARIRQVDIVHARGDAGPRQPVVLALVGPRCIDHQQRPQRRQIARGDMRPVEPGRRDPRPRALLQPRGKLDARAPASVRRRPPRRRARAPAARRCARRRPHSRRAGARAARRRSPLRRRLSWSLARPPPLLHSTRPRCGRTGPAARSRPRTRRE